MSPTASPPAATERKRLCFEGSKAAIARNSEWLAGGVSSNFRLNISPTPLIIDNADGAYLYDIDGNRLIDYYLGMGPMILGHKPKALCDAVTKQLEKGILFGAQSDVEAEAARLVCEMVPSAERMRFGGSGSEVIQAAFRIARAATGRDKILKFEGHYHGWFDNILWSVAPGGAETDGYGNIVPQSGSQGQLASTADGIAVLPWNDLNALKTRLARGDIAAVIMEPAMCNAGAIQPRAGYLEGVRKACTDTGTILIFDEVITGFRVGPGGAQQLFGVTPDLSTFGKAIANGFPVAAVVGRAELLDLTNGKVLHGGTYNAQPLAMAATVATLRSLTPDLFGQIEKQGERLKEGMTRIFRDEGIAASVVGFPQVFHVAPGLTEAAQDFRDLRAMNRAGYVAFTTEMMFRGVRALERGAWFLSSQHDDDVIDETLAVAAESLRAVKDAGKI